jgi:predicted ester cyclase
MSLEEIKIVARRHFEKIWNEGELDLISTYFAPDFLNFGNPCPLERVRQIVLIWRTAFPDLQFTIEEQIAEADQVLSRCTCSGTHLGTFVHPTVGTLAPTGKRFAVQQMHLTRVRDSQIVEHWAVRDDLGMVQQLGLIFSPVPEL